MGRRRSKEQLSSTAADAAAAAAAAAASAPAIPGKQAHAMNNCQLSLIDQRDWVVMYTALGGTCDKL